MYKVLDGEYFKLSADSGQILYRVVRDHGTCGCGACEFTETVALFADRKNAAEYVNDMNKEYAEPKAADPRFDKLLESLEGEYVRIHNALLNACVRTMSDLLTKTEKDLLLCKGFGFVSLKRLRAALAKQGLKLAGDPLDYYQVRRLIGSARKLNLPKEEKISD